MFLRAAFWIGVVAVLMPHEPDLGLGRSVAAGSISRIACEIPASNASGCRGGWRSCAVVEGFLCSLRSLAATSLAGVKADLEAQERTEMPHNLQTD